MSAPWHCARLAPNARHYDHFGFYDSAYQIVVMPQQERVPHLIVDHEMSHVYAVMNSSIGALERILVWLEWTAHAYNNAEAVNEVKALMEVILSETETVHEAVAWFGTELQSEGHENLNAPAEYAPDVQRLRQVFTRMPEKPPAASETIPWILQIADCIAIYALSPPLMAILWSQPELISVEQLRASLRRNADNPLHRFRKICARVEEVPFQEALKWARALGVQWRGPDSASTNSRRTLPASRAKSFLFKSPTEISAGFRSDLLFGLDTARLLRTLGTRMGLFDSAQLRLIAPPSIRRPGQDPLLASFASFEASHGFRLDLDTYAQVCVCSTETDRRDGLYHEKDVIAGMSGRRYLIVRLMWSSNLQFARPPRTPTQVIITGPADGVHPDDGVSIYPTWYADIAAAGPFLASYGRQRPIVASSVGYDFGAGDYAGAALLRDVPHVVLTIRDFRSLWGSIRDNGLRGCRNVEWMALPSPSGRRHFGFFVLKPSDSPFPIVVNPTLVYQSRRAVTVAEDWPSTEGTRLVEYRGDPYHWMGPMAFAALTAAAVFEFGDQDNAVSETVLQSRLNRLSEHLGTFVNKNL
jgi:hypothetical protein